MTVSLGPARGRVEHLSGFGSKGEAIGANWRRAAARDATFV
jgi:hypothetical protein